MNNKQKQLLKDIKAAFSSVRRENGTTLHQTQAIDDYEGPEQELAARKLDTDKRWEDVSEQDIIKYYSALSFLDNIGYRYYIPAHMSWAVKNYKLGSFDFLILDRILYSLDPGDETELAKRELEKFELFNKHQKEVICRFLEFMRDEAKDYLIGHCAAEHALQRYWGQFSAICG